MAAASLEKPYPAEWTVRRALENYLSENGFTAAEYDAKMTPASFLGIRFSIPNTNRHRAALRLHDLHHVVTGYGTDLVGEGEISAWEARGGLLTAGAYVASIVVGATIMGLLISPSRAINAWRAAHKNLFAESDYQALLDLTVGDLRARLGVPQEGLATLPRKLHAYAPRAENLSVAR